MRRRDRTRHRDARGVAGRAARAAPGREGADPPERRGGPAAPGAALGGVSRRSTASAPTRARPRWPACSAAARNCSCTTSCSGPSTRAAARPARPSPTASTASSRTSSTTTSLCHRRVARAAGRSCRPSSSAGLDVPVGVVARQRLQRRLQRLASPRTRCARAGSCTTTARQPRDGHDARPGQPRRRSMAEMHRHRHPRLPAPAAPGMSAFARADGVVYHTYSTYARGGRRPVGHVPVARPRAARAATMTSAAIPRGTAGALDY